MSKLCLFLTLLTFIHCSSPVDKALKQVKGKDVLLVSDHTLPEHLSISSGGANGIERTFIDPTLAAFQQKLTEEGLSSYILNVEDMVSDKTISTEEVFYAAYNDYDRVLKQAVESAITIIAIHYDANIIPPDSTGNGGYVGGVQVILDRRAVSPHTLQLATDLIHKYKILESLHSTGLRIRPNYEDSIRYQGNLTLNIIGHSKGGAFLLEIGPQDQAVELFGTPKKTVKAIDSSLELLASAIKDFRSSLNK